METNSLCSRDASSISTLATESNYELNIAKSMAVYPMRSANLPGSNNSTMGTCSHSSTFAFLAVDESLERRAQETTTANPDRARLTSEIPLTIPSEEGNLAWLGVVSCQLLENPRLAAVS